MELLTSLEIAGRRDRHRVELWRGDLSKLPASQQVDLLVVSAFPNDYTPTSGSLIGALAREGISVGELAASCEIDMREDFSCWISRPVAGAPFQRLLCVESGWNGSPPENTDDLFRALTPASISHIDTRRVAMPIIGAGDQGWSEPQMLEAILAAAQSWFTRGLPIEVLMIVVRSEETEEMARRAFDRLAAPSSSPAAPSAPMGGGSASTRTGSFPMPFPEQPVGQPPPPRRSSPFGFGERLGGFFRDIFLGTSRSRDGSADVLRESREIPDRAGAAYPSAPVPAFQYDVFVSYSHTDGDAAQAIVEELKRAQPDLRIFFDRTRLHPGSSWLMTIADALDGSRRVLALYTPDYWTSPYCKDEFGAAYVRQQDQGQTVLFPIHFRAARIPYLFRTVQYEDCVEADPDKLTLACQALCGQLGQE